MRNFIALSAFAAAFVSVQSAQANIECPKQIRVQVDGLKSTPATNSQAVEKIYQKGDKQTTKDYIVTVLRAVNQIESVSDVLMLSREKVYDSGCLYKGKSSTLTVRPNNNEFIPKGYRATLSIGKINFKSATGNPTAAKGYSADLTTQLTAFNKSEMRVNQARAHYLTLDLMVQVPFDGGTDGFDETVKIGQAQIVRYTIVR